ncbi:hypothetical protein HOY80DRAFT_462685 [Tuber brumale]|nr:hypothetical protein HOY80DRAFT_462685 [Tuber brumale]
MKPAQHALALSVAGLCGTAYALPQIPYYASRFPQHPQNLGHAGNYPKYWQGESYTPGSNREPAYYNWNAEPEPETAPPHPDFAGTRHPAKGAIKYYGAQNFPTKSVAEPTDADTPKPEPEPENASSSNIKITNDTPSGPAKNDKSYTRITKSSSVGGPGPAPAIAEKKVVTDKGDGDDAGSTTSGEDVSDDLWNSFSFGVVSDTLNYHDPYEGREGEYKRKTNAISKIEKMMGKEYSAKEIADASSTSTPSNSRVRRRGLPHRRRTANPEPIAYQRLTTIKEEEEEEEKYYEPEYDNDHIRIFGYDIRGYDLPTLKLIDAYEREAHKAGVFRPFMYNPHIPDLTMDADGNWKTPAARQPYLTKRGWPEHIRAKAEKMMHSAKNMQEKGQLVIDNDPTYQKSLREKELATAQATAKPETAKEEEDPLGLLPATRKGKGSVVPNRKASLGGMSNTTSHPPQNTQPGSITAEAAKQIVQKQPSKLNNTDAAPRKGANRALLNKQLLLQKKKKHPMPNFPKQGRFKGGFMSHIGKRDTTYLAGPEYPPGTTITRKKKCDDEGKCVTVDQPVAIPTPVVGAKAFVVKQITDGQPQIHPYVAPQPIAPAPVHAPVSTAASAVPHTVTAPAVKAPTPQVHPPATVEEPPQAHLVVTYVPVVKPGRVLYPEDIPEEKVEVPRPKPEKDQVEEEAVRMPCGCECSSCSSCEYDTAPVATCPCGDPECGKGPGECTCGAPGCNCNERTRSPRSSSTSYSNGVKNASRKNRPGRNTSGGSNRGGHTHGKGRRAPSTPAELETFWRKQVPGAFKND